VKSKWETGQVIGSDKVTILLTI